ncbi:hypothetical protein FA124_19640 [Pseudomonas aeruginosa]|nr:hypothetical protein [Pseudomonas aeruginosa]HBO0407591.1 hypothetical protein [Pseudomonas aeruginosa]HCF1673275.1 hypothetical protein [Pseudomonas aeruginosa]HCI5053358.1 hypothetical protein [Pseudomonas aeruginosa]HCJ4895214.1 hypothetical protein [Pseudomonas aeruginosa]
MKMQEEIKYGQILLGAGIGLFLMPFSEWLKYRVGLYFARRKLLEKLSDMQEGIHEKIPALAKLICERESFIQTGKHTAERYRIPSFEFLDVEKDIESCYTILSKGRRHGLTIIRGAVKNITGHSEDNAATRKEQIKKTREEFESPEGDKVGMADAAVKIREIEKYFYRQQCQREKAIIYTATCLYYVIDEVVKDNFQRPRPDDNFMISKYLEENKLLRFRDVYNLPPSSREKASEK